MITLKNNSDIPSKGQVFLYFGAPWCSHCKFIEPRLKVLAESMSAVKWIKINTDDHEALADEYKVDFLPTIVALQDGKEVKRASGIKNIQGL